jgi:hypothetical protein
MGNRPSTPVAQTLETRILPHLARAARALAIKGFAAEEAAVRGDVCDLLVRSEAREIEGRIEFRTPADRHGEVHWLYAVSSANLQPQVTNGVLPGPEKVTEVIAGFVSVFTTVASFSGDA